MDNKSGEQFPIIKATIESNIQATIEANSQDTDYKLTNLIEDLKAMITSMMDQTNNSKSSPD